MGSQQPIKLLELDEKYGPVVRVVPNDLSLDSAASWRHIYRIRKGHKSLLKSELYDGVVFAEQAHWIVSEGGPVVYG